jgi:hypothetical protein
MKKIKSLLAKITLIVFAAVFGFALGISPVESVASGLEGGGKITCHSSSNGTGPNTHTACSTCQIATGIGSDEDQCRPN